MGGILGIHGIFQIQFRDDPRALERIWRDSMSNGMELPPDHFALVYYSDLLDGDVVQENWGELDAAEQEIANSWLHKIGAPDDAAQGPLTEWIRDGLDWVIRTGRARGLTLAMVRHVLQEVALYTSSSQPGARIAVRQRVADAMRSTCPDIVLAHSLGSVVAYETLWANPDISVPLLMTLGSPLALSGAFYDRLEPNAARAQSRPPGVRRWANFADVGDLVAVPKHLSEFFEGVDLDETVIIDDFECHKIAYYLRSPQVRRELARGLAR